MSYLRNKNHVSVLLTVMLNASLSSNNMRCPLQVLAQNNITRSSDALFQFGSKHFKGLCYFLVLLFSLMRQKN